MPSSALRTKPKLPPKYERRVWQIRPYDWRWEIREFGGGYIKSGTASGPADANRQIRQFLAAVEAREKAKWMPIHG